MNFLARIASIPRSQRPKRRRPRLARQAPRWIGGICSIGVRGDYRCLRVSLCFPLFYVFSIVADCVVATALDSHELSLGEASFAACFQGNMAKRTWAGILGQFFSDLFDIAADSRVVY